MIVFTGQNILNYPEKACYWIRPNSIMDKLKQGIAYFKEGQFDKALEIFNLLVEGDPSNTQYIGYRGRILSRKGSYSQALKDYDQLLRFEPHNTDFIGDRAVVLHLLSRNEEALSELNRALDLDPDNPYRYSSRAFLKDGIGDYQGAIADYEKAIEIDPEDAVAFNNKGLVEEKLGYKEQSIQSFRIADHLAPKQETNKIDIDVTREIPIQLLQTRPEKKLTLSSYLSTFSGIFTNRETRKDFFRFLASKIKGK